MAKYESTGTWFDPAEVAKRKRRWAGVVVSVDPGDPTCVGVWFGDFPSPGVCEIKTFRTWEKPKPMTNQTKVSVNPGGLLGPFQCPPHEVQITTPAGATINAEQAAQAFDGLKLYQEQSARGWKAAEDNAKVGMGYLRERDEARAERNTFQGQVNRTREELQHTIAELADARATRDFYKKRCAELVYGPDATGKPAPAVTKDTVVTLGMLQELIREGGDLAVRNGGNRPAGWVARVIDRRVGK